MQIGPTQPTELPLFKPIDTHTFSTFLGLTPALVGAFALAPDQQPTVSLSLFKKSLILRDLSKNFSLLQLDFDVKLEILYENCKDVRSEIIGFRLYSEDNTSISFYSSEALHFTHLLAKTLNMRGFQEMFRPIRKLGRGNFATVYEAERVTDRQRFAVKAFSKQNSYCSQNGKDSLKNELSLLRSLNVEPHPNVLRLQAVYESQNSIYVVLQLLEGKTLMETLQERKGLGLSEKEVKIIIAGLLKGIGHLCKNRVMHRDLKPQNIMIRKTDFEPVIVDFGLSTNVDLPEYLFFRCGTPGYVAPEIIALTHSIHLEPTCDMFSLGVIFHVLLTNKPLFRGTKYDEVYRANKQLNFKLEGEIYSDIGVKALSLMKAMLVIEANLRITADSALMHPYFTSDQEYSCMIKQENSTVLTATSHSTSSEGQKKQEKKKKRFFFF